MQKLQLKQQVTPRLSPQQIQLIKTLQVPSVAMKEYLDKQLTENPLLEEAYEMPSSHEEVPDPTLEATLHKEDEQDTRLPLWQPVTRQSREALLPAVYSLQEKLLTQLRFISLNARQYTIGQHVIGNLDRDGYLRCDLETIVNDLVFSHYIEVDVAEVTAILHKIQDFDPPGIAARNLQECLLLQLTRRKGGNKALALAIQIVTQCFDAFTRKHYDKIAKELLLSESCLLKEAVALITKLNPKPGSSSEIVTTNATLHPDFIVTQQNGHLQVMLYDYPMPVLRIQKNYRALLTMSPQRTHDPRYQEAVAFVKKKITAAQWLLEALQQRQVVLLRTMQAIVALQHDFFIKEEMCYLKPMVLRDIAEAIDMDPSTVSRIVNNKAVQTACRIYPLKFFFSEGIRTTTGEEVSNKTVKQAIAALIQTENKEQPYSDDQLTRLLREQGYAIARRTVAKYREQLRFSVARLRREVR